MTSAKHKKKGRPSLYTDALAANICRRLAEGETLRAICRDKAMPDKATVLRWLADKAKTDFRDQYAHAREMQADALFDEALEIVYNAPEAVMSGRVPAPRPGQPPRPERVFLWLK